MTTTRTLSRPLLLLAPSTPRLARGGFDCRVLTTAAMLAEIGEAPAPITAAQALASLSAAVDRAAVLDCLRVRDLGGDWLGHSSFDAGAHSDVVDDALVRDGLARWDEFGIHITPAGRRAWADQRNALRDLTAAVEARS